jgi:AcrR family transcriptional regulator
MRLLAKEAGIPAPTLYGYFASKEAVLGALADEKIAILRKYVLGEAEDAKPGVGRLMAFARGYRRFALEGADYYDMFISRSSILSSDSVRDVALAPGLELIRTLAADVREAIGRGEMITVDPEETIIGLWAVAHGYISLDTRQVLPTVDDTPEERESAYLRYFEAMLRGMEAVSPSPETSGEVG